MRKLLALVAFAASLGTAQAGGGYPEERPFSWTGFYLGGHAGVATGDTSSQTDLGFITLETDYGMNGAIWGGHVGYNYQMGRAVVGIEGTLSSLDLQGDSSCVGGLFSCSRSTDWVATVVGRLGFAMDRALIYGLAGVAWGEVDTNAESIFGLVQASGSARHVGWVAGVGLEYAVTSNLIARVEYNHIDLGSETHDLDVSVLGFPLGSVASKVDLTVDTIKVGASWKFN